MKANRMFALVLALTLALSLCLGPAGAAPGSSPVFALIYDELTAEEFDRLGVEVVAEYDAYTLVKGSAMAAARIAGSGLTHDLMADRTMIHLRAGVIDTSGGIASVPADLRMSGDGLYLVQLIGPIMEGWKAELETYGTIHDYIPNFTYVMELNGSARAQVARLGFVNWVGAFHPAYRLAPEVLAGDVTDVTISWYGAASPAVLAATGLDVLDFAGKHAIARGNLAAIKKAARLANVAFIEPFEAPELLNNISRTVIKADYVHGKGLIGINQIGAVTDTGVYTSHECFAGSGKIVTFIDKVGDAGSSGGDGHGHGTHCAGSVLGDAPTYNAYNKYDGQGLGARLIPVKVFTNGGSWGGGSNYYGFWKEAYDAGARVNSNSWGSSSGGAYGASDSDADRVVRDHRDYVVVIAAGNSGGSGANTIGSPANAKNVISVGALLTNSPDSVASFSSRGPTNDNRLKPDVMAPGSYIRSAQRGTTSGYTDMQGTSMACPQVAGAALLVRDYFVRGFYPTGSQNSSNAFNPSAAMVKAVLINGAVEITGTRSDWNNEGKFPNNAQGWGRVNLERSLFFVGDERLVKVWDSPANLSTGNVWSTVYNVPDGAIDLKVTLTWTDYWASSGASVTIRNDLHLRVTAPNGSVFLGNNFQNKNPGYSVTGGSFDVRNTVEGVHLLPNKSFSGALPTGNWTIEVIGNNIPNGPQDFALVVSQAPAQVDDPGPDPDPDTKIGLMGDYGSDLYNFLTSVGYDVVVYSGSDYTGVINNLPNLSAVVLHRVSNATGFNNLINAAATQQKGLIFTSQYSYGSYGLGVLRSRYGDPQYMANNWGRGAVRFEVLHNHPILTGYSVGQTVTIINGGDNDYQSFTNYTGTTIGRNIMGAGYYSMIGFKDRAQTGGARHAAMASFGSCVYTRLSHWTADGRQIFVNAIEWARGAL